jgi:hypothetical protein
MARRKPSADLSVEPDEIPKAAPQPHFEPVVAAVTPERKEDAKSAEADITGYSNKTPALFPEYPPRTKGMDREKRPKIVVRVNEADQLAQRVSGKAGNAAGVAEQKGSKSPAYPRAQVGPRRARPFVVAAILIVAFTGMLLATHRYVTSQWNPFAGMSQVTDIFVIGREGVTTTDVRLRPDASTNNPPIGLAENGSRVKILAAEDNWYQVQVLQHSRPKTDPFSSDRGWLNKRFVKLD